MEKEIELSSEGNCLEGIAGFVMFTGILSGIYAGAVVVYKALEYAEDLISKTDISYFVN